MEQLEDKLENILTQSGEEALNTFRDNSRKISLELNMLGPYKKLERIIGTILGPKDAQLYGKRSIQRAVGLPEERK